MGGVVDDVTDMFHGFFGRKDDKGKNSGIDPEIARQQAELEAQQRAALEQEKKKLEQQRIASMRGRFGGGGGGGGGGGVGVDNPANTDNQAASLFSRITGRTDA